MKAKRNLICDEVKRKKIKECWTCECGKHHINKNGAELCCTDAFPSKSCNCRHCSKVVGGFL